MIVLICITYLISEKKTELALHEKERKDLTEQLQEQISARNKERDQLITVIGVNEEKIGNLEALNASLNRQLLSLSSQRESLQRQFDDLSEEYSTFKVKLSDRTKHFKISNCDFFFVLTFQFDMICWRNHNYRREPSMC